MRNKEFIPYEQALALQQLGFNEECFGTWFELEGKYSVIIRNNLYGNDLQTPSPLYQQAFRWFREKYDLFISIFHYENGYALNNLRRFDTHEEAEVALLTSLIELAESMV